VLRSLKLSTNVIGHSFSYLVLHLGSRNWVEYSTPYQNEGSRRVGMFRSVGKRQHRAPGSTDQGRTRSPGIQTDDLVQVSHVPRHREAFAAALALEWFNHPVAV
jgi:hypothetical protein